MSGRDCDAPQPSSPHVNKGKTSKKRSHDVLKILVSTPSLAPISSPSPTNVNIST